MIENMHITLAAWGEPYLEMFLNFSLPSLLSANNIPAVVKRRQWSFKIHTLEKDKKYIEDNAIFQKLKELVSVEIKTIKAFEGNNKFSNLVALQNASIADGDRENAGFIFWMPDYVIADGALPRLLDIQKSGKRVVLLLTLRLIRESARPDFERKFLKDDSLTAQPRELVRAALPHLHPIEKTYYWSREHSSFPIHSYWPVGDEGILGRCLYLHPLMVLPRFRGPMPVLTMDADYVDHVCPDPRDIYISRDSDELSLFELTGGDVGDANACSPCGIAAPRNLARWAVVHANPLHTSPLHHWYYQTPIRIHAADCSPAWDQMERKTADIASSFRRHCLLLRKHGSLSHFFYYCRATATECCQPLPVAPGAPATLSPLPPVSRTEAVPSPDTAASRNCARGRTVTINLIKDVPGEGWGEVVTDGTGKGRNLGIDGRATLDLQLSGGCSYTLTTRIFQYEGSSLHLLRVLINNEYASAQHVLRHNGQYFHKCIIPKLVIKKNHGRITVTYQAEDPGQGPRAAMVEACCRPTAWSMRRLKALPKFLLGIVGPVNLGEDIPGEGWGRGDYNIHDGLGWRWMGDNGQGRLVLPLLWKRNYLLRTETQHMPEAVRKAFRVMVNGIPAQDQRFVEVSNQLWHFCTLPKRAMDWRRLRTEVTYHMDEVDGRIPPLSMSRAICTPLRNQPKKRDIPSFLSPLIGSASIYDEVPSQDFEAPETQGPGAGSRRLGRSGEAQIFLWLAPVTSFLLKTQLIEFHDAHRHGFSVAVNGVPAKEQQFINVDGAVWHWCILPWATLARTCGRCVITYRMEPRYMDQVPTALTRVFYRAILRWI